VTASYHRRIGRALRSAESFRFEPLDGSASKPLLADGEVPSGAVVEVRETEAPPKVQLVRVLAAPGTARARLYQILDRYEIDPCFAPEVYAEVQAFLQNPGWDDPTLRDLTPQAFITIDNESSRDLDQAMFIERAGLGYRVYYALADTSHYVRPGSALYSAAMKRGVTLYLPSMAVPMLPEEFSEGLVSLNEGVPRRALTMIMSIDADGVCTQTQIERTKIQSRKKLTYEGVQAYHEAPESHALAGQDFTETLQLLKEVGELRIRQAEAKDVVRIHRLEVRHSVSRADPTKFETYARARNDVERWNEQISLLCNSEGAKIMKAAGSADYVTPIFRIHPEPVERRLEKFRDMVDAAVQAHGVDPMIWAWQRVQSLADYLGDLPTDPSHEGLSAAIQRQAVMVNSASEFSVTAGKHHGVGVDPYARFSSPMREMVGVYTHKEALEKMGQLEPRFWPSDNPRENQALVVDVANRTRKLQRQIAKEADRWVLDQHLQDDLHKPEAERAQWQGTIMGLTPTKVYIQMRSPPFDVKLYLKDLSESVAADLRLDKHGVVAKSSDPSRLPHLRLGDSIRLRLQRYDFPRGRYIFRPAHLS
jgi:ribonuclease R